MDKKSLKKYTQLKYKMFEMNKGGYIPPFLYHCTLKIDINGIDKLKIYHLMYLYREYIRVKGYYCIYENKHKYDNDIYEYFRKEKLF